ncbi:MAG: hypothetical protein KJI71_03940 [Patescibacteria group bacterium]|nr:hypothetical protein [Patescibacteria group bacterium]
MVIKVSRPGNQLGEAKLHQKEQKQPKFKEWRLRGLENVSVMMAWSFTDKNSLPQNIPEREYREAEYLIKRTNEALNMRINEEDLTRQRGPVLDSGKHLCELKPCQGGWELYKSLTKQGWSIVDIWYQIRESENSRVKKKGHKKYKVVLIMSRNAKKVKEEPKGLENLMKRSWIAHVWDNSRTPNRNFTVNFTFMLRERSTITIVPSTSS